MSTSRPYPPYPLVIDEETQDAFNELMSSISSSDTDSSRQLEEDIVDVVEDMNAYIRVPIQIEGSQEIVTKLYLIESDYNANPECIPTISKLLNVFITTAAIAIGSFILGALVGAVATSWSGPGMMIGAIIGGLAGLLAGGALTSVGFFCECKPKPLHEQTAAVKPETVLRS
jgi:hypothetical protein